MPLRRVRIVLAVLAVAALAVVIAAALRRRPAPDPRLLPEDQIDRSITYSNILPQDYVGPESCGECHTEQFEQWKTHPHRKMNQLASAQSVVGDFNGAVLQVPHGRVTFTHEGEGYYATVEKDGAFLRKYQITRTVGTVYQQYYIAKQIEGPEPRGHVLYREHMLPFGYWMSLRRWLPKNFLDADGEEHLQHGVPTTETVDYVRDVRLYNEDCMNCHNTYAYAYRVFHRKFSGFPFTQISGAPAALSAALAPEVTVAPTVEDFEWVRTKLDPDKNLVTQGISCESCHFGGREHAVNQKALRFAPTSPFVKLTPVSPSRVVRGDRHDPESVNGICAQCHSGNSPLFPNGASIANSSEALDFVVGHCSTKMSCTACHNPHEKSPPEASPTLAKHVETCLGCHTQFKAPAAAAAHTRHSDAVSCLDCHMPRQVLGLEDLVRTHRIARPVERSMVESSSVNACNLCHLDKPITWTVAELERGWGEKLSTAAVPADKREVPMGELWLRGSQPLRLVATGAYAHSPLGDKKLPELLRVLNDAEPINRIYAIKAVQRLTRGKVSLAAYDPLAAPTEREKQVNALLSVVQQSYGP